MKLLFLDIETSPNSAYVWGLWQQNVSISQMIESSSTLCWAAKWASDKDVLYSGRDVESHLKSIKSIHKLLSEADIVCTYNGNRFDIPTLNKEFLLYGLMPPAPSKSLDLYRIIKSNFKFPSHKLDYVAQKLGLGGKTKHEGFELWVKCMLQEPTALAKMQKYNKQDVILLEKLYYKILPWVGKSFNINLYNGTTDCCPTCGGEDYIKQGFSYTTAASYQKYQCKGCGSWFKSSKPTVRSGVSRL